MELSDSDCWTDEESDADELLSFEKGTQTMKRRQRASAKLKRLVANVCESIENICGSLCNIDNITACQNITVAEVLEKLKRSSPPEGCWSQFSPCDPTASSTATAEMIYSVTTDDIFDGTFPVEDEDITAYRNAYCEVANATQDNAGQDFWEYTWLQPAQADPAPTDEEEFDRISDHTMRLDTVTRAGFKDDRMVALVVL